MRVLVTGAAGFLASHLCDALLARGDEVIGIDDLFTGSRENLPTHPRFEFVRHDVRDPFRMEVQCIWHLACPASPQHYQLNGVRTIETAFIGTRNALECARNANAKLVCASTSEVYGCTETQPIPETCWGVVNPVGPRSQYDEGKRSAEALAYEWNKNYGTDVRIARIFNTYGPRLAQGDGRVISNFIVQALRGEPLTVYGDGSQTRSFCFVSDLVDGLIALAKLQSHRYRGVEIVNLGNPDERTILSAAEVVSRACGGIGVATKTSPLPQDDPPRRCPDITRARELLKWEPSVSFEEGIARTVEWFRGRVKGKEAA